MLLGNFLQQKKVVSIIKGEPMKLTYYDIAQMIDLSAVQPDHSDNIIQETVRVAMQHHCFLVTTLPSQTNYAKELLKETPGIKISGNVGFPSGGQTTRIKSAEARELVQLECDELDMVISIGKLISGDEKYVFDDIKAVIDAAEGRPVKVILECHYLNNDQIRLGSELAVKAGAAFIKTGTGYTPTGATLENVSLIKSIIGDSALIKASGGVRSLDTILEMYRRGARRFGIGIRSASLILQECSEFPGGFTEF